FDRTLAHLVDHRLLTLDGDKAGTAAGASPESTKRPKPDAPPARLEDDRRRVDIAHEALISGWPELRKWIQARGAAEQTRRQFEDKAQDWAKRGEGKGGLLDESELPEVERWLARDDAVEL